MKEFFEHDGWEVLFFICMAMAVGFFVGLLADGLTGEVSEDVAERPNPVLVPVPTPVPEVAPHQHRLSPNLVVIEATTSTLFLRALGSKEPFLLLPRGKVTTRTQEGSCNE